MSAGRILRDEGQALVVGKIPVDVGAPQDQPSPPGSLDDGVLQRRGQEKVPRRRKELPDPISGHADRPWAGQALDHVHRDDEIEAAVQRALHEIERPEADVGESAATGACALEGGRRDVHRLQDLASCGKHLGERSLSAADLKAPNEPGPGGVQQPHAPGVALAL